MVERLTARVTLLRLFVAMSGLILGIGGIVLGSVVTGAFREQAVEDAKDSLGQYVDGVLVNELVTDGKVAVRRRLPAADPARAREPRRHPEREGVAPGRSAGLDQP